MHIHAGDIAGWRWILIVEGIMTVVAGIVGWFFLAEFPQKVTFLSASERLRVLERLQEDRGDAEPDNLTPAKVIHHLNDIKIWGFGVIV